VSMFDCFFVPPYKKIVEEDLPKYQATCLEEWETFRLSNACTTSVSMIPKLTTMKRRSTCSLKESLFNHWLLLEWFSGKPYHLKL